MHKQWRVTLLVGYSQETLPEERHCSMKPQKRVCRRECKKGRGATRELLPIATGNSATIQQHTTAPSLTTCHPTVHPSLIKDGRRHNGDDTTQSAGVFTLKMHSIPGASKRHLRLRLSQKPTEESLKRERQLICCRKDFLSILASLLSLSGCIRGESVCLSSEITAN